MEANRQQLQESPVLSSSFTDGAPWLGAAFFTLHLRSGMLHLTHSTTDTRAYSWWCTVYGLERGMRAGVSHSITLSSFSHPLNLSPLSPCELLILMSPMFCFSPMSFEFNKSVALISPPAPSLSSLSSFSFFSFVFVSSSSRSSSPTPYSPPLPSPSWLQNSFLGVHDTLLSGCTTMHSPAEEHPGCFGVSAIPIPTISFWADVECQLLWEDSTEYNCRILW